MQGLAILEDSIRALRSRYLFWISLAISVLSAVALFGMIGFTEEGWRILWFEPNPSDVYRADSQGARDMMAWLFNSIYVRWWLSWAAIVLAVISTASLIPDFLATGSIELSLSKPISRLKLFSFKVLGAMLFVVLQVTLGVVLAWLLMGVKVGVWLSVAFWAIPLITLQFFYLYSISALVGVVTRSTLASLLLTVIAWAVFSSIQFASNQLESNVTQLDTMAAEWEQEVDSIRSDAEAAGRPLSPMEQSDISVHGSTANEFRRTAEQLRGWQRPVRLAELAMPKTADIQKILANKAEAPVLNELLRNSEAIQKASGIRDPEEFEIAMKAGAEGQKAIRAVHPAESILSSLVLPVIAMAGAAAVFMRRDY